MLHIISSSTTNALVMHARSTHAALSLLTRMMRASSRGAHLLHDAGQVVEVQHQVVVLRDLAGHLHDGRLLEPIRPDHAARDLRGNKSGILSCGPICGLGVYHDLHRMSVGPCVECGCILSLQAEHQAAGSQCSTAEVSNAARLCHPWLCMPLTRDGRAQSSVATLRRYRLYGARPKQRHLSRDGHHGHRVQQRISETSDQVRRPRSAGGYAHANLAGHLRIPFGRKHLSLRQAFKILRLAITL